MVSTIAPLVQAARRQWAIGTSLLIVSSVVSGGLFGVLLGAIGTAILRTERTPIVPAVLGILAVFFALIEAGVVRLRIPTVGGSISQRWWRHFGPWSAPIYGAILGVGVTTFVPFVSFYLIPIAAALSGPVAGGIIGASYGLGRSLAVPIASIAIACGADPAAVGGWAIGPRRRLGQQLCTIALLAYAAAVGVALSPL